MFKYKTLERKLFFISCMSLIWLSTLAPAENIISLKQINPDKACGPRCLWAIMQSTGTGKKDCDIKCIYKIIDKEVFSVTNLKDIKYAAQQLGFSVEGYKLTLSDLRKMKGFFILPIGITAGTTKEPLHFILVSRVTNEYVVVVDTKTLKTQALPISDLKGKWKGYVLVISTHNGMPLIQESNNAPVEAKIIRSGKDDQIKDFGLVESASLLEHTFEIWSEADGPCDVKIVKKSCSCLTAILGKNTNGRTILTMKLRVDKPAWQEASAIVSLEPTKIIKQYTVRAYGSNSYQTTPQIGYIEAPNGGMIEYPVTVAYFTDVNDVVKFSHIESDIPNLEIGSVECEKTTKGFAKTFNFQIPLVYDAGQNIESVKNIKGEISFVLDTIKGQRFIPLKLSVKIGTEKYRLYPEKVFMITSKSGKPTQKKVKVKFLAEPLPAHIAVKSDEALPLEIKTTRVSKDTYMINISATPEKLQDVSPGMKKGEVTILLDGVSNCAPITLPISLFVRE